MKESILITTSCKVHAHVQSFNAAEIRALQRLVAALINGAQVNVDTHSAEVLRVMDKLRKVFKVPRRYLYE